MLRRLVCVLALSAALSSACPARQTAAAPRLDPVRSTLEAALAEPALAGGRMGVIVESLKTGERWLSRNSDCYFMPASNQKLITSAASISLLGPGFRYATCVLADVPAGAGRSTVGDLVLRGSGDPLLVDSDLDEMAQVLRASGVRRVSGRMLVDDTAFDPVPYGDGWSWDDMSFYYSARVSGLNLNENVVQVHVEPGEAPGAPARVGVTGTVGRPVIHNEATTGKAGVPDTLVVERDLGGDRIVVRGAIAVDAPEAAHHTEPITVNDPALYCGRRFLQALKRVGIEVGGTVRRGRAPAAYSILATHMSAPMSAMLAKLNKPSDNLVAECFLKTLGAVGGGQGSWAAGRSALYRWLETIGISREGIEMADGSGLSRQNLVTPDLVAKVLKYMASSPNREAYLLSLPIAGVDGTLRNRMKGTPAQGNCRGKTGYVRYVSSLSGYVTTAAGEPLLFVMLMNQHRTANTVPRAVQDRFVALLAGLGARQGPGDVARSQVPTAGP